MTRRDEFVVGDWHDFQTAEDAIRTWRAFNQPPKPWKPPIFRLVPVPLAEVEAQAAREREARKGKR